MKFKNGLDLCGFALTNFCIQGLESMPSDAALGRKYFHTNATDDVATGISLLNRERIYLGEGAWRATAYLDDIAAINEKLNLITGDTDTDTLINNLKDLEEFLKDFSETDKLKSLLDGKLSTSGGTLTQTKNATSLLFVNTTANPYISFQKGNSVLGHIKMYEDSVAYIKQSDGSTNTLIHSGNSTSYNAGGLAHSNGTIGAVVNSSGNVLIGTTEGTRKLVVTTTETTNWAAQFNSPTSKMDVASGVNNGVYISINTENESNYILRCEYANKAALSVQGNGNVLIGTTTDSGYKLDVAGNIRAAVAGTGNVVMSVVNNAGTIGFLAGASSRGIYNFVTNRWVVGTNSTNSFLMEGFVGIGTNNPQYKLDVQGDTHITGNLIVDGEVSAGGAGAEESTSGSGGSVDFHSEDFTPSTSTTYQVNHNLGKKVIVQVYEQGATSETWNLVMVDVEIISATRLDLRFGKIENTPHRVVVMGAGV